MAYTVKTLSKISGVTVRSLHFYEDFGLFKPAYYGSNGYRYYEEKQLLELQQILFFKELGLSLKQIKKVFENPDFDRVAALQSHKQNLTLKWHRLGELIKTVDRTINHLKGVKKMKNNEFFHGFSLVSQAKPDDSYFKAEWIVLKSVRNPTKSEKDLKSKEFYDSINKTYKKIADCIEKGLDPVSETVQKEVAKHHHFADQIHDATQEVYFSLAQLYREHPEFRKQLDSFHPKLADFLSQAMSFFAHNKLR